jgi:DNA-binding response OmpR family regulator
VRSRVPGEARYLVPSVLVIDDATNVRELVALYFTAAGFDVRQAADGASGLAAVLEGAPDLVLLDIMLPVMDGTEVCRRIREVSDVPVIMLSARAADLDKVSLLEAGADDYVVKPFSPPELVARVRAVLRRGRGEATESGSEVADIITVGGLTIDTSTREVRVDGTPVELTAKEFDLLATMAAEPGIVFARDRLLQRVWGFSEFVEERGVDVHVRHLRDKLGDDAGAPRFIETVRGVGYRIRKDGV